MTDAELEAAFAEWADEARDWAAISEHVSSFWAVDWDSPEDTAAYG
jgi:hypothetical protein